LASIWQKTVFQLHGAAADGSVVFRKKLSRPLFARFMSEHPPCLVAMEACSRRAQSRSGRIEQPLVWKFGHCRVTHPGIPIPDCAPCSAAINLVQIVNKQDVKEIRAMVRNKVRFPKGLSEPEFERLCGIEEQCRAAVVASRWPQGFI